MSDSEILRHRTTRTSTMDGPPSLLVSSVRNRVSLESFQTAHSHFIDSPSTATGTTSWDSPFETKRKHRQPHQTTDEEHEDSNYVPFSDISDVEQHVDEADRATPVPYVRERREMEERDNLMVSHTTATTSSHPKLVLHPYASTSFLARDSRSPSSPTMRRDGSLLPPVLPNPPTKPLPNPKVASRQIGRARSASLLGMAASVAGDMNTATFPPSMLPKVQSSPPPLPQSSRTRWDKSGHDGRPVSFFRS